MTNTTTISILGVAGVGSAANNLQTSASIPTVNNSNYAFHSLGRLCQYHGQNTFSLLSDIGSTNSISTNVVYANTAYIALNATVGDNLTIGANASCNNLVVNSSMTLGTSNLSPNAGFITLPEGVKYQWGLINGIDFSPAALLTWPTPFTINCFSFVLTANNLILKTASCVDALSVSWRISTINSTSANVLINGGSSLIWWMAIGV